jgi:hypothetical protein
MVQFGKDNMAVHFYRELNNLSKADFLVENRKKKREILSSRKNSF